MWFIESLSKVLFIFHLLLSLSPLVFVAMPNDNKNSHTTVEYFELCVFCTVGIVLVATVGDSDWTGVLNRVTANTYFSLSVAERGISELQYRQVRNSSITYVILLINNTNSNHLANSHLYDIIKKIISPTTHNHEFNLQDPYPLCTSCLYL